MAATGTTTDAALPLSVVVPVFNERDNVAPLVAEIVAALRVPASAPGDGIPVEGVPLEGTPFAGTPFEIVFIDDQSSDDTVAVLQALQAGVPELRVLRHSTRSGQSTAIRNGVRAARGTWIATLDGDGQNDPADIPRLIAARAVADPAVKLFAGWRTQRNDPGSKRWASRWANAIRARVLHDATPDTGCGIKLFERSAFLDLPGFDHMHRYLPALMQRAGWQTLSVPVAHRARGSGVSKYNNLGRAIVGISDLAGVSWLIRRNVRSGVEELP